MPAGVPWVLEPTGRYGLPVVRRARAAHRAVLLAPPRQAKFFLASVQTRAKTDRLDSRGLALFALSQPLAPYPVKTQMQEKLDQLLSVRKNLSGMVTRAKLQARELPPGQAYLTAIWQSLTEQIKTLDKEIARLTQSTPEFAPARELRKVPGFGLVITAALISRLSHGRFSNPNKFVAYIGLDVRVHQSGQHCGQKGLSHQGDAELRRLLYVGAQSSLRCKDSPFKAQYERERGKGLSSTAALCAVSRKMAKVAWSIVTHNSVYDAARVHQQSVFSPTGAPPLSSAIPVSPEGLDNEP